MKTKSVFNALISIALLSMSIPVSFAQPAGQTGGQGNVQGGGQGPGFNAGNFQQRRQRMLQRFDTNHDGVLDENERAQMRAARERRRAEREQNAGNLPTSPSSINR